MDSILANVQQQTGAHSPRSLSPVSRASLTCTTPPELQDAESLAAAPLDITSAILPENPGSAETISPGELPNRVPDTPVPPPPPLPPGMHTQSELERYPITPGTTMDTRRTTDPSGPLLAPRLAGQPQPVGRCKRAWGTCKKCVKTLCCCFTSG